MPPELLKHGRGGAADGARTGRKKNPNQTEWLEQEPGDYCVGLCNQTKKSRTITRKGVSQGSLRTASSDAEASRGGVVVIGEEERRFPERRTRGRPQDGSRSLRRRHRREMSRRSRAGRLSLSSLGSVVILGKLYYEIVPVGM